MRKLKFSQVNNPFDNNNKLIIIKKENKNDCRNASLTKRKANSFFKTTNLTKKPITAEVPTNAKNNEA